MMQGLLNAMRLQAQMAEGHRVTSAIGVVTGYDSTNYCAKVRLQPGDVLTGWLPVVSPWVGNSWGLFAPPTIGDVVEVHFQEDDIDAGYVSLRFFNDSARPLAVPSGEFWLVHASGSLLKFHNNGTVELVSSGTLTSSAPQWNHAGNVKITGTLETTGKITGGADIQAAGNVSDQGGTKTMAGMRTTYNSHTHNDPQGGTVSTPNGTM